VFASLTVVVLAVLTILFLRWREAREIPKTETIPAGTEQIVYPAPAAPYPEPSTTNESAPAPRVAEVKTTAKPAKVLLGVPFTSQAPKSVWDALHEDACEEASLIMAHRYIDGTEIESIDSADQEINDLIKFEESKGLGTSITLEELNNIAKEYYGMNSGQIVPNVTSDILKDQLAESKVIILPAAGKLLNNPNFKNGGPNYHMLVVKGFENGNFITNDPGTRKGEGYQYTPETLIDALHDWNPDNILNGEKNILVFAK
jgi:hypothetical protein